MAGAYTGDSRPRATYEPTRDAWGLPLQPTSPELPSHGITRDRAPEVPRYLGEPGVENFIAARTVPSDGRVASDDPGPDGVRLAVVNTNPVARGGGPPANVTDTLHREVRNVPVALPIGCTRLSVAGTPQVRSLSARFLGGPGRDVRFESRGPRFARGEACIREAGTYEVQVAMTGPRRALIDAEVFTPRDARVSEPPIQLR